MIRLRQLFWFFGTLIYFGTLTNCANNNNLVRTGRSRIKYGPVSQVPGPATFWFPRERTSLPSNQNGRSEVPVPSDITTKLLRPEGNQGIQNRMNKMPLPMMMSGRDGRGMFDWLWGGGGWYYDYPPPPPPPQVRIPQPGFGGTEQLEYCEELYDVYYDEYYEDCVPVYKSDKLGK